MGNSSSKPGISPTLKYMSNQTSTRWNHSYENPVACLPFYIECRDVIVILFSSLMEVIYGNYAYKEKHKVNGNDGTEEQEYLKRKTEALLLQWEKEQDVFVESRPYRKSLQLLDERGALILIGQPGDGKSVIGQRLLQHYQSLGYDAYCVTVVDEFLQCWTLQSNKPLVIFVDDVFGRLNFCHSDAEHWHKLKEKLATAAEKNKFIFTSRKLLYTEFCAKFVADLEILGSVTLDLSDTNVCLMTEEKYQMLQGYCDSNHVNIIVRELKSIASSPSNTTSYPFACKFFTTVIEFRKKGGEFFQNPIASLLEYVEKLRQMNKAAYFCLVVLMLSGGQLQVSSLDTCQTEEQQSRITTIASACGLTEGSCTAALKKCLVDLTGVLLTQDESSKLVEFLHEIVEETIVVNFGRQHLEELLMLCSSSFIQQHVDGQVPNDLVIQIAPVKYKILAKRFLMDILEDNADWVFKNPLVRDVNFQKVWCKVFGENLPMMHKILEKEKHCWSQGSDGKLKVEWNGPACQMKGKSHGKSVISVLCWAVYSGSHVLLDFLLDRVEQFLPVETMKGTATPSSSQSLNKPRQPTNETASKRLHKLLVLQAEVRNCIRPSFIHIASSGGDLEMMSYLLQHQVSIGSKDTFGLTPILCAAMAGHVTAVKLLLDSSDSAILARDSFGRGLLYLTSLHDMSDIVETVISKGAVTSKDCRDSYGITPLHLAAMRGDNRLVSLLLKCGFDVTAKDFRGCTPLHHASAGRYEKIAKLIIDAGGISETLDKNGMTSLHHAARSGADTILVRLLEHKEIDIDLGDNDGNTAAHLAAQFGHSNCLVVLLDKGANVAAKNSNGWAPLHLAAQEGRNEVIGLLLKRGASLTQLGGDGETPLHCAASYGHVSSVLLLLELGASISARDARGWTPLHSATWIEQEQIVALLLEKGANPADKTVTGRTALDFAELWHSKDMIQLMTNKLADEWC